MREANACAVENVLLKRRQDLLDPTDDEIGIVEVLGDEFLKGLDDPDLFDVALSDLRAVKEMRPDLGDKDIAYLVQTADDDEDAEAWTRRVIRFEPQDRQLITDAE